MQSNCFDVSCTDFSILCQSLVASFKFPYEHGSMGGELLSPQQNLHRGHSLRREIKRKSNHVKAPGLPWVGKQKQEGLSGPLQWPFRERPQQITVTSVSLFYTEWMVFIVDQSFYLPLSLMPTWTSQWYSRASWFFDLKLLLPEKKLKLTFMFAVHLGSHVSFQGVLVSLRGRGQHGLAQSFVCFLLVLRIESRVLNMSGKYSTTKMHP